MFFLKTENRELILILDVQSSVVRGSLAIHDPSQIPHIIFSYNAVIPWKSRTDSNYLVKTTLRAVSETVEACRRFIHISKGKADMPSHIGTMHFILSSPWIISHAKVISESYAKPMIVTHSHVMKLIEADKSSLGEVTGGSLGVIEQKIFAISLNGYPTASWEDQQARHLEVSYAMSAVGSKMIERFKEACGKGNHSSKIRFHSSLLMQKIGLQAIMPDLDEFALLHIHGELTDLALINGSSCTFFGSFPFGVRTLVRKIAAAEKTDIQTADSLLTLYTGGHFDETHSKDSMERIKNIGNGWTSELSKILNDNSSAESVIRNMPRKILASTWSHDDFFLQAILNAYPKSKPELISIESITPKVAFDLRSERRRLTGLYALAIHIMGSN